MPDKLKQEIIRLKKELDETRVTLNAIYHGEVDALIVKGPKKDQVYTLKSADYSYRIFLEEMKEGAVTLGYDGTIFFANGYFAKTVRKSHEKIIGSSIFSYIHTDFIKLFQSLLEKGKKNKITGEINLVKTYSPHPFSISLTPLSRAYDTPAISMIITDLALQREKERIEQSEKMFRNLADSLPDIVCKVDCDLNIVFISRAFDKLTGRKRNDFVNKSITLYLRGRLKIWLKYFEQVIQTGKTFTLEETFILNKEKRVFNIRLLPEFESNGKVTSVILVSRDITKSKTAESLLVESRKKYKNLTETINDFIWETDTAGRYTYCSPQMKKLWNLDPQKMLGKTPFDMMPLEQRSKALSFYKNLVKSAKIISLESISYDGNGKLINIEVEGVPFFDNSGKLLGYRGITRDITAKKKAENEIKIREHEFHTLADNIPDVILRTDLNFNITFINHPAQKIYGNENIVGKNIFEKNTIADEKWKQYFLQVRNTGQPVTYQQTVKNGRIVEVRIIPERNDEGKLYSLLSVSRDITDRIAEDKRRKEFISTASHELKTPITSLKAYSQILSRRLAKIGNSNLVIMSQTMEKQIDRLTKLISDLLDVTKIEVGKMIFTKEAFDMNILINETVNEIRTTTTTTTSAYDIQIQGKIKKQILADRFRIGQVMTNLLTNAVKYSPHSNKVIVSVSSDNQTVKVAVRDYGMGISLDAQKHLFERFFQAHAAKNQEGRFSSLGLGLYISSQIIQRHGGKIWCESREGKGSTFFFTLPLNTAK